MFNTSNIRISELQRFVNISKPGISKHFKDAKEGVVLSNKRIIGITPEAASAYIEKQTNLQFQRPSVTLSANLCGGVGKTTTIFNLAAALRRISSLKDEPIVLVDGDSQGSLTHLATNKKAADDEPVLIDYFEGKATIEDILCPIAENTFIVKSNLNSAFIDKVINRPGDIKKVMREFYTDLFEKLGGKTKIFQDHTPHLSNLFASSVTALYQLPENIVKNILIPLRGDNFALQGAKYILQEIEELKETYSFPQNGVRLHCYFSSLDRRISSSGIAMKNAMQDPIVSNYLCPVAIRYSAEIPKSIMNCTNLYEIYRKNNAADDYQDLLQYIYNTPNTNSPGGE